MNKQNSLINLLILIVSLLLFIGSIWAIYNYRTLLVMSLAFLIICFAIGGIVYPIWLFIFNMVQNNDKKSNTYRKR